MRKVIPGIAGWIPATSDWEDYVRNTEGVASLYDQLTPEEKARVVEGLKGLTVSPAAPKKGNVPMKPPPRPVAPAGPGAVPAGGGVPVSVNGTPAGSDGKLVALTERTNRILESINRNLGPSWGGASAGPLPIDGGDVGPRRV